MQAVREDVLFKMLNALYERTQQKALCLAGGVAFNCAANGKILVHTPFQEIYVQPAAGDGGLAVGAAYYVYHQTLGQPRSFVMDHAYWGPAFASEQIRKVLDRKRALDGGLDVSESPPEELVKITARHIADGKVVDSGAHARGWDRPATDGESPNQPALLGAQLLPAHPDGCARAGQLRAPEKRL